MYSSFPPGAKGKEVWYCLLEPFLVTGARAGLKLGTCASHLCQGLVRGYRQPGTWAGSLDRAEPVPEVGPPHGFVSVLVVGTVAL